MNKNIKISKLEAAKRQLETTIRLYFNEADPVSIHTLTLAAHGILSDLNKQYGGNPMLVSDVRIKEKFKKEFRQKINEARNHFKHADRNPNEVIDFNPEVNEFFIYDACVKYKDLAGEDVSFFNIFSTWFIANNLKMFDFDSQPVGYLKIREISKSKSDYFSHMLSISGYLRPVTN